MVSSRNWVNSINIPSCGYETETPPKSAKLPVFAGCDCGSIGKKRLCCWLKNPGLIGSIATGWPAIGGSGNAAVLWVRPVAVVCRLLKLIVGVNSAKPPETFCGIDLEDLA